MKKFIAILAAFMLPLLFMAPAQAAKPAPQGALSVDFDRSEFPVTYPGYWNTDVKNVYLNVEYSGTRKFDRVGVSVECSNDNGVVYSGWRTVVNPADFGISFYVSVGTPWLGEPALCDLELIWESWNRKSLYQFGGVLDTLPSAFTIGQ